MKTYGKLSIINRNDISHNDPSLSSIPEKKGNILVHVEDFKTATFSISEGTEDIGFFIKNIYSFSGDDLSTEQKELNKKKLISQVKQYRKEGFSLWVVDIAYKKMAELGVDLRDETDERRYNIFVNIFMTIVMFFFTQLYNLVGDIFWALAKAGFYSGKETRQWKKWKWKWK